MKSHNDCMMNNASSDDGSNEDDEEQSVVEENIEELENEFSETDSFFNKTYQILSEEAVSLKNIYVLQLETHFQNKNIKLVAGLSNFSFIVYNVDDHLHANFSHAAHDNVITGLKFVSDNENLFYSGSLDGTIKLWDMRTKTKPSIIFKDDTDDKEKLKPINCFDVSCDNKFICAGTPLVEADSYLLFWDIRKSSVLGGYWESHTDDITQIKFNSNHSNSMLSGSTDGLINIFDVSQSSEDDALQNSLNVGTAIRKLEWLHDKNDSTVGCITDMETLQLWKIDDAQPFQHFTRENIGSIARVKSYDNTYIADIHPVNENEITIIAGSNANKGNHLKSLVYSDSEIHPSANFENNKQLIRCTSYDKTNDMFVTAGESGIITVWIINDQSNGKIDMKERVQKTKYRFK